MYSPEFSRQLGQRGWLGLTIPEQYTGRPPRSVLDRFVITEELLAVGAPVAAHWFSERQTAPILMTLGSELQRERFLPAIARGECYFSIGMSEPDAGSDLAGVRTQAVKVDGGWSLSGTKVWTSHAHRNHFLIALCRTSPLGTDRHEGLSQLIVDLAAPGVDAQPIATLDGPDGFSQVTLDDVRVPDEMVLGVVGNGWQQVNSELAFERSGPDRWLSTYGVLELYLRERVSGTPPPDVAEVIGRLTARMWTLRQLSLATAGLLDGGARPLVEGAIVKDLGTVFEQQLVEDIQALVETDPDPAGTTEFERLFAEAVLAAPSFTIRGGTTEVLRIVTARALKNR
jgi:alkylation response protein AidB-like acyl-CoA dehydrogenase